MLLMFLLLIFLFFSFKTAPNVWVMNNVIDTFARILNDDPDQSVKSNLKFYFSTIPFVSFNITKKSYFRTSSVIFII